MTSADRGLGCVTYAEFERGLGFTRSGIDVTLATVETGNERNSIGSPESLFEPPQSKDGETI
jgi:hypothetical protein